MNNVKTVIFRAAGGGGCLRSSPSLRVSQILARTRIPNSASSFGTSVQNVLHTGKLFVTSPTSSPSLCCRSFASSPIQRALRASGSRIEQGLAFRSKPLSNQELRDVYGQVVPPTQAANRLLRILHGRRVDGTLDLPLPADLQPLSKRYPYAIESALFWLRSNYNVDEDAAILARIEREESDLDTENPSDLMQRGQRLGLYGPQEGDHVKRIEDKPALSDTSYHGPQSGNYQAELSEKGDVFGRSAIEKIRAENEAKSAREEEELEQQISQITERETKQISQDTALTSRPEQGIEAASDGIQPPNEFDKWVLRAKNRSTSKLTLESPEIKDRGSASRLLPSLILTIGSCYGLYYFTQTWEPPKRSDRIWPDMALSFATVCGLTAINVAVYVLWKFPPAWSVLNRYFLLVPATIRPLSLIGSMFSHIKIGHLAVNTVALVVFGPSLHEDLGRAQFLACYLAGGIIGNYVSLLHSVARGIWVTSSLGASGSAWAILAAFCTLHSNGNFTIAFLPEAWKDTVHVKGWMFLLGLIAYDCFGLLVRKNKVINYWAHFGGAATGWAFATIWKKKEALSHETGDFVPTPSKPWWELVSREIRGKGTESKPGS